MDVELKENAASIVLVLGLIIGAFIMILYGYTPRDETY